MQEHEPRSRQSQRGASAFNGMTTVVVLTVLLAIGVHCHRRYSRVLTGASDLRLSKGTTAIGDCGGNRRLPNGVAGFLTLDASPNPRAKALNRGTATVDEIARLFGGDIASSSASSVPCAEPARCDPGQVTVREESLAHRLLESF